MKLSTFVDYEDRVRGKALDISAEGIRINASRVISAGTLLSIIIPLCAGKIEKGIIKVIAEVKWNRTSQDGMVEHGLEFFCINEFEKAKLSDFISDRLSCEQ
jgi:hypothetical protein